MPDHWNKAIKKICLTLLKDVKMFSSEQNHSNYQTLAALEMFFYTFKYFVGFKTTTMEELISFFQEQMLRYLVEVRSNYNNKTIPNR